MILNGIVGDACNFFRIIALENFLDAELTFRGH